MSPGEISEQPGLLERFGARFLRTRAGNPATAPASATQAELMRLERHVILRAALAGAISSVIAAAAELAATSWFPGEDWGSQAKFWAVVGVATGITAVLEIVYLYWDALASTHRMARLVGVEPWLSPSSYREGFTRALARAALELPNGRQPVLGVNPDREVSKAVLIAASLAYKLKVAATTLIIKLVVRRVLSRAAVRVVVLPLIAVPVTAVWNAIVAARIIREARIRANGPAAVARAVEALFGAAAPSTPKAREAVMRAVASTIVRTRDLHPNLLQLLQEIRLRAGELDVVELDSPALLLELIPRLSAEERHTALEALVIAATIDGRLSRRERRLLEAAFAAASRPAAPEHWRRHLEQIAGRKAA